MKPHITMNIDDYIENQNEILEQLNYEFGERWIEVRLISWEVW